MVDQCHCWHTVRLFKISRLGSAAPEAQRRAQCRYLNRVDACVKDLQRQTRGGPVSLLAHSAGGWLARVYLLGFGTAGIDRLVTLGSPHQPPPKVQNSPCCALLLHGWLGSTWALGLLASIAR